MSNARYVPGEGNPNSKIVICGEAPGRDEDREERPFVGEAGKLLNTMLYQCGIRREEVWVTNVVKERPENNDFTKVQNLDHWMQVLKKEIENVDPNVIIAFGNNAMRCLTTHETIRYWRGSVLPSVWGLPKVVPTFHPAHLLWNRGEEKNSEIQGYWQKFIIEFDIKRAIKQSAFKDIRYPQRFLHIARNAGDVIEFLERNRHNVHFTADIETYLSVPMCIAFAFNKGEALSIPLWNKFYGFEVSTIPNCELVIIWREIDRLLRNERKRLVGQNWKFDDPRLLSLGFVNTNFYYDTMLGMHYLYIELPKSQAFQTSFFTDEPYYKDEGREFNPKKDKVDRWLLYNAKDAAVDFEIFEEQMKEIEELERMAV